MTVVDRQKLFLERGDSTTYRLATNEDLKPGTELFMILVRDDNATHGFPTRIVLDETPVKDRNGVPYVFYHQKINKHQQCFVEKDYVVKPQIEADQCGPYLTTLYLARRT